MKTFLEFILSWKDQKGMILFFVVLQKTIEWKINKYQLWFVQSYYCLRHIWIIFNKYTLTCKIRTIKIGEREITKNVFIDINSENFTRWRALLLQKYMIGIVNIFSPFGSHSQFSAQFIFCNENFLNILHFNRALNPDKLDGSWKCWCF